MKSSKNNAIYILPNSEEVLYYNNFLLKEKANDLYEILRQELDWKQYPITLFGKTFSQPRLVAWYGQKGTQYRYSKTTLIADGWTTELEEIQQSLQTVLGTNFNSVLANLYRDGQDSMGWHSDDEKELGPQPIIASLSLGATRKLQFRKKINKTEKAAVLLESGSLLIMQGNCQQEWQHQIAKTKTVNEPRINLTFRFIQ